MGGNGAAGVALAGLPLSTESAGFLDWEALRAFGGPVLVVQGENDEWGAAADVRAAIARERVPAHFLAVPRSDHFFTGKWGVAGEAAAEFLAAAARLGAADK